ncbi:MAG TPA: MBOAT family protein [Chloroflexota bacterium]|nr:MBOAT family protein [Chloroflexota bacterium]
MIFPTLEFATFFALVLPLSWALMPWPRFWKPFMIVASYIFYGSADLHFIFLLAGCTAWNQAMAKLLARTRRRGAASAWLLTLGLAGDLGLLGWFKYYGFFATSFDDLAARFGLVMPMPLLQVALPIGISFFTFQAMSYLIDVHRGACMPVRNIDFALYLSFFPHLIAGPIVRVSELVPQFSSPRDPTRIEAVRAFGLISGGLMKKVLLADPIATQLVDPVFGSPLLHSRIDVIVAMYAYAVQIYCDFSAYSDMAIGLALLLGFQFPQNFNRPYAAITLQDFWRRWHMSLSRWLRDYLYISLGGNRKGRGRTYINLMVTMLLGGLWHGAAWKFAFWGGLHGTGLAVERWWDERRASKEIRLPWARWFLTFNLVCVAWVFFRADSLGAVGDLARRLTQSGGQTTLTPDISLAILLGLALQFVPTQPLRLGRDIFARLGPVPQGLAVAGVLLVTGALVTGPGVAPFIYYRF